MDNGVPLATCLYLFGKWVRKLTEERNVIIMEPGLAYSEDMVLCALATWSGEFEWFVLACTHRYSVTRNIKCT